MSDKLPKIITKPKRRNHYNVGRKITTRASKYETLGSQMALEQ